MSLLEALVALTMVSGVVAMAIEVTQSTLNRAAYAQLRSEAINFAESVMARVGKDIPLEPGRSQQVERNGIAWDLEVQSIASYAANLRAYQIKVDVSISRGWLFEQQSLEALKLSSGALQ